jgi:NADPH-dependent glutamate synthase beta subunit-like oxidoreductase/NAD-dependent dihydropyrimidine dehydrogenase PreA subunit
MVNIEVNGKKLSVPEDKNLLECMLDVGIYVPHLCHHPSLKDIGACKMCVVEVKGENELQTSCTMCPKEGMVITTENNKIKKHRTLAMELILSGHPEECTGCPKYGNCELQKLTQYIDASNTRLYHRARGIKPVEDNPHINHDMNRCILCGRCVRACKDLRAVGILEYTKKDRETVVRMKGDSLKEADCRFCTACVEVCPTGSIRDKISLIEAGSNKEELLVPCKNECPAHTDIPKYLRYASEGKYEESIAVIREKLPMPNTLGYICSHLCESKCKRTDVNAPLSIKNVKRFVAENTEGTLWKGKGKKLADTGKKVVVIGGGPAGLTSAYYLRKQGHDVIIKEALPRLGGMLRYGIPNYRLPDRVIDEEIDEILSTGIKVELNTRVDDIVKLKEGYDAVLIALGAHNGVRLPIENNNVEGVLVNIDFLRKASQGEETGLGEKVVVLGGGNVAFDCARTAVRLGAKEVHLACLESREKMTADKEEIEQGQEEGITLHAGRTFESILADGKVTGMKLMEVENFYFDENRRAVIEKKENSKYIIEADTIIFAVGQRPEFAETNGLKFDENKRLLTNEIPEGIFITGDALTGTKSVIQAVAGGRDSAMVIDTYLGGDGDIKEIFAPVETPSDNIGLIEKFGYIKRTEEIFKDVKVRKNTFDLITDGIGCDCVQQEASRCLQCDLRLAIKTPRSWNDFSVKEVQ